MQHTETHMWVASVLYSPHIAPGWQPEILDFLPFIQACLQFLLHLCPPGLFYLLPPLILLPLPVPPLSAAVQVQLRRRWREFCLCTHIQMRLHTHSWVQ